jgi:hypothetical protein
LSVFTYPRSHMVNLFRLTQVHPELQRYNDIIWRLTFIRQMINTWRVCDNINMIRFLMWLFWKIHHLKCRLRISYEDISLFLIIAVWENKKNITVIPPMQNITITTGALKNSRFYFITKYSSNVGRYVYRKRRHKSNL